MSFETLLTNNFEEFSHDTPLSKVAGALQEKEKRCALIFQNNKFLGMLDKRELLHAGQDLAEKHAQKAVKSVPLLHKTMELEKVAHLFFTSDMHFLPVEEEKSIVGVVSALDVCLTLAKENTLSQLSVGDVKFMKPKILTADDSFATAMSVMFDDKVDLLPVFDAQKVVNVVKYKDIIRRYLNWSPQKDSSTEFNQQVRNKAAQVDTTSLAQIEINTVAQDYKAYIIQQSTPLATAIAKMIELQQTVLLVYQMDEFKGLLTVKNILGMIGGRMKVKQYAVEYRGLSKVHLSEHQEMLMKKIVEKEAEKLQRKYEDFTIIVHLKEVSKEGKQHHYNVHVRIEQAGKLLSTSEKEDWDFETALHKCFNMFKDH